MSKVDNQPPGIIFYFKGSLKDLVITHKEWAVIIARVWGLQTMPMNFTARVINN